MTQTLGLLVQTNKKGFGLALWEVSSQKNERSENYWQENCGRWANAQTNKNTPQIFENLTWYEICEDVRIQFLVGNIQTAEGLADGVMRMKLNLKNLTHLVFAAGPGSFTGLRLGCAFCSGIATGLGEKLKLFQVGCKPEETIRYSLTQVGFEDILESVAQFSSYFKAVNFFVPNYGALPGPVKLLQEKNEVLK
jgi:tRNA N6-adenosine threonylcarbamoyltransferase